MIKEQLPPDSFSVDVIAYFQRMNLNVESAIAEVINIIPVREIPDRPIEGVLYYLLFNLPELDFNSKGYWYWTTDDTYADGGFWEKLVVGSEISDLQAQIDALEERVTLLETP